jgi:hypothetical protein
VNGSASQATPSFIWLFFGKVVLLFVTILVVWTLYAYLHAYRLDWLGYFYSKLLPLTNGPRSALAVSAAVDGDGGIGALQPVQAPQDHRCARLCVKGTPSGCVRSSVSAPC